MSESEQETPEQEIDLLALHTWTIPNLAQFLQKRPSWVYDNYRKLFPYYRIGNQVRFDPETIRAVLNDRYGHNPDGDNG